jgi:hypothetical protein
VLIDVEEHEEFPRDSTVYVCSCIDIVLRTVELPPESCLHEGIGNSYWPGARFARDIPRSGSEADPHRPRIRFYFLDASIHAGKGRVFERKVGYEVCTM